jgi:hypothetical protein
LDDGDHNDEHRYGDRTTGIARDTTSTMRGGPVSNDGPGDTAPPTRRASHCLQGGATGMQETAGTGRMTAKDGGKDDDLRPRLARGFNTYTCTSYR